MKKQIKLCKVVMIVVVLFLTATLFTGCSKKLSGTYSAEVAGSGLSYKFSGSDVTVSISVLGTVTSSFEGTYSIDDSQITLTFEDDDAKSYSGTFAFKETDDSITIGVATFTKK